MNAFDVKTRLSNEAEAVCRELLPIGRRQGRYWLAGSVAGDPGESLKVYLGGPKAGTWRDYDKPEDYGDLLDLWGKTKGIPFSETFAEAKRWLGIPNINNHIYRPKTRARSSRPGTQHLEALNPNGEAVKYLTNDRGLNVDTLRKYGVREFLHQENGSEVVFPITAPDSEEIAQLKYLAIRRHNGQKRIRSSTDPEFHLFGWKVISANERSIYITEGEIDCMTLGMWEYPALSIPSGTGNLEWIQNDYEQLERFATIYLAMDSDKSGQEAAQKIAERLGRERCRLVKLPCKDVNECHLHGHSRNDFAQWVESAETFDPPNLRFAREYSEAVNQIFWPSDSAQLGTESPLNIEFRVRTGEITLITGFSGHGKSVLLSQFLLHDMHQDQRVCIASMEMRPEVTLSMLVRQYLGRDPLDKNELESVMEWLNARCWIYDKVGSTSWHDILEVFSYASKRYGCTRFAIDSLLFCGIAPDDYSQQREIVVALCELADSTGSHVYLVAHSRKKEDESRPPGKLDVKGSGDITDVVHNGFTMWRNKGKEREIETAKLQGDSSLVLEQA